jgi:energy-coupling factor transporter ATP-binding protein EcfA2
MSIADKHVTALIGPSGCGKTTLLRCCNRLHDLYSQPWYRRNFSCTRGSCPTCQRKQPGGTKRLLRCPGDDRSSLGVPTDHRDRPDARDLLSQHAAGCHRQVAYWPEPAGCRADSLQCHHVLAAAKRHDTPCHLGANLYPSAGDGADPCSIGHMAPLCLGLTEHCRAYGLGIQGEPLLGASTNPHQHEHHWDFNEDPHHRRQRRP